MLLALLVAAAESWQKIYWLLVLLLYNSNQLFFSHFDAVCRCQTKSLCAMSKTFSNSNKQLGDVKNLKRCQKNNWFKLWSTVVWGVWMVVLLVLVVTAGRYITPPLVHLHLSISMRRTSSTSNGAHDHHSQFTTIHNHKLRRLLCAGRDAGTRTSTLLFLALTTSPWATRNSRPRNNAVCLLDNKNGVTFSS